MNNHYFNGQYIDTLVEMAKDNGVIGFWKVGSSHGYMSQWAHSEFEYMGDKFYSAEQYMMWSKALLFGDEKIAKRILKSKSSKEQKKLGREVKGFKQKLWKCNREKIVIQGNLLKFSQNPDLKAKLVSTGEKVLVEASPSDSIWGIGLRPNDPNVQDPILWKGENLLGKCLMVVRGLIK